MGNYYPINPIKAYINSNQIFNEIGTNSEPCEIIRLSIYKNEVITAIIKLTNGAIFSYIPFNQLSLNKNSKFENTVNETHFLNAPDYEISISYLNEDVLNLKRFDLNT